MSGEIFVALHDAFVSHTATAGLPFSDLAVRTFLIIFCLSRLEGVSQAGWQLGVGDERSMLIREAFATYHRLPKAIVQSLENVLFWNNLCA